VYRVFVGKSEGRSPQGDLGVGGLIILGWTSRKWVVGIWNGLGWSRLETVGESL